MTAAQTEVQEETDEIQAWRSEELERVGYGADAAAAIAARHDIDLHRATDLLDSGCPAELALQILL